MIGNRDDFSRQRLVAFMNFVNLPAAQLSWTFFFGGIGGLRARITGENEITLSDQVVSCDFANNWSSGVGQINDENGNMNYKHKTIVPSEFRSEKVPGYEWCRRCIFFLWHPICIHNMRLPSCVSKSMKQQLEKLILLFNKKPRFWLILAGIIISLIAFEEVVDDVFDDPLEGDHEASLFDQSIANWVLKIQTPLLNQVMIDLTSLGSVSVVATLFIILASVMVIYRDIPGLIYLSSVLAGAGTIPFLLKNYFQRERPIIGNHLERVTDLSFPSGHTFAATALYIALAYYAAKIARSWYHEIFFYFLGALLIVTVGVSRIYLGVHFSTDVIAGLSSGAAWGFFMSLIFEIYKRQKVPPKGARIRMVSQVHIIS